MYCDEITLTDENIFEIIHTSVDFKMDHLEDLCAQYLSKYLSSENVVALTQDAFDLKATALKEKCFSVFGKSTSDFCKRPEFCDLSQPALSALLDAEKINLMEISLFQYVKKWMEHQCEVLHLPKTGPNMRQVISDALYKIHFPTMSVWDFSNEVAAIQGLLSEDEVAQVFRKITTYDKKDVVCQFPDTFRCSSRRNTNNPVASQYVFHSSYYGWMTMSQTFDIWKNNSINIDLKSILRLLQSNNDEMNASASSSPVLTTEEKAECCKLFSKWNSSHNMDDFNVLCSALARGFQEPK